MCSTIVEQGVQRASTAYNIFENKGKIEWMLKENLNRFKLDSTRFQRAFDIFTLSAMLDNLFKRTEDLVRANGRRKHWTFNNVAGGVF